MTELGSKETRLNLIKDDHKRALDRLEAAKKIQYQECNDEAKV